jgi:hypothetical protein
MAFERKVEGVAPELVKRNNQTALRVTPAKISHALACYVASVLVINLRQFHQIVVDYDDIGVVEVSLIQDERVAPLASGFLPSPFQHGNLLPELRRLTERLDLKRDLQFPEDPLELLCPSIDYLAVVVADEYSHHSSSLQPS